MASKSADADDSTPLQRAIDVLGDDGKHSMTLVAAALVQTGSATAKELASELPLSQGAASAAVNRLEAAGLAEGTKLQRDGPGRSPTTFEPAGELAWRTEESTPSASERTDAVITVLARLHYRKHLSTATAKQIASRIPGASSQAVAQSLRQLNEEGAVERVRDPSPSRWRLAGADEYVTYRVGGESDGE